MLFMRVADLDVAAIVTPHQSTPRRLPSIKITQKAACPVWVVYFSLQVKRLANWVVAVLFPGKSAPMAGAGCLYSGKLRNFLEMVVD
uniref:Uncharacterized protein n=1 Tax=Acidithiobacillus sulfuriphilus TaxID=1867749 RepID=A0A3M8R424_9PROT|nr:hypothetical protein EC580_06810 [Acidithiobacillus sulfuriphilus]